MTTLEAQDMAKRRTPRKMPIGGIAVIVIAALAVVFFIIQETAWSPFDSPPTLTQPVELRGNWLGMWLAPADSAAARAVGVPPSVAGVVVAEVVQEPASRAAQAGLLPGDVVVSVDGTSVADLSDLLTLAADLDVGRPLAVGIMRMGQPMTVMMPPPVGMVSGMGMPGQAVGGDGTFLCPNDGLLWSQAQVAPGFRCPRCGGALVQ